MSKDAASKDGNTRCAALWHHISDYTDGVIAPDDAVTVEQHVASCAECAADIAFLHHSLATLRSAPPVEPPSGLRDAILAATVGKPTAADRYRRVFAALLAPVPARALAFTAVACAIALGIMRPSDEIRHPDIASTPPTFVAPGSIAGKPRMLDRVTLLPVGESVPIAISRRVSRSHSHNVLMADLRLIGNRGAGLAARSAAQPLGRGVMPKGGADAASMDRASAPVSEPNDTLIESEPDASPASPPVTTAAAYSGDESVRTTMVSSANTGPGQITTLSDIRRSLREQATTVGREIASIPSPRRQIRLDVIHSSF
jgi:anti-sigma factor RsiW